MATDSEDPQASIGRFKDTVAAGESVEVKISGKWEDGSEFEAYDHIRLMDPGR